MVDTAQWDLFRTFEAIARLGSLTAASKALGVSQSTVSRHLGRLEEQTGSPLLLRESPVRLTQRGAAVLEAVKPMVDAALVARAALEDALELQGEVVVTTVGEVLRWVLVEQLASFFDEHPQVRLRILADNEVNSLAAGEADIALRMARPARGDLVARRLSTASYGFHAASSLRLHPRVPWLGLAGTLARIPEQHHAERAFASRPPRLLVEDLEALGLAVEAGLGVAVLPRQFASGLSEVVEVEPESIGARSLGPVAPRDLWMVVHRSKQHLPKVRAVIEWLERAFAGAPRPDR